MSALTGPLDGVLDDAVDVHEASFRWGDASPADLIAAGVKWIGEDPDAVVTESDEDGNTVWRSVDDIVPDHMNLPNAIRRFRGKANNVGPGQNKRDILSYTATLFLKSEGQFFQTPEGIVYYFYDPEKRVYRVSGDGNSETSQEFRALVSELTGVSSGHDGRAALISIYDRATRSAPERETHRFAAWDEDEDVLYITDFNDGYYALDGNTIDYRDNGEDVFFLDFDGAPYEYLPESERASFSDRVPGELHKWHRQGDLLMRFFGNRVNFDPDAILTPEQQRTQMYVHLHAMAFLDYFTAKPITAFVGEKGSGKTVIQRSVGKFLFGDDWTESMMPSEREDFAAIVNNRPLAFIDNFDSAVDWANDILASVATGSSDIRRQLYTTMDMAKMNPDCFMAITSRDPPFRRDDVADRTIVFRVTRLEEFIGMRGFLNPVGRNRDTLWSVYLDNLNEIVDGMRDTDMENMLSTHRMSGWAAFAKVTGDKLDVDGVDNMLRVMEKERALFALEDDPLFRVTREWLSEKGEKVRGTRWLAGDLLDELQEFAKDHKLDFTYKRSQTLGKRLSNMEEEMDELFGFQVDDSGRSKRYEYRDPSTAEGRQGMLGYGHFAADDDDMAPPEDEDGEADTSNEKSDSDAESASESDADTSDPDGTDESADADESGGEKTQSDRRAAIKNLIEQNDPEFEEGVPRDLIVTMLKGRGFRPDAVRDELDAMTTKGILYEPNGDYNYRIT